MKTKSDSLWRKIFSPKTAIGFLVSALGLYLGFRKFNGAEFLTSLEQTNLGIFGLAMVVMVLMVMIRAWRWKYLLYPIRDLRVKPVFEMEMIGFFGNNVFPFRLGEILRAYSMSKALQIPAGAVLGTIVVERILDSLTFLVIMILGAIFFPKMPAWVRYSGAVSALIILIFGILIYISQLKREALKEYVKQKMHMSTNTKIAKTINHFWQGISTLRRTPHLGLIALQSALIWIICIVNTWIMGAALHFYFSLSALLLIFFVTSMIISVPSAPGYVGTYHAATIGILVYLGLNLSNAQAVAVIMHAVGFIVLTAFGLVYFLKYQINVRDTSAIYSEKGV
ncbi:MAG: lysylphosphatidylglycerol synthase transmembrane domain-containing protein [Candidatus Neomarinimicrobiota bacterium]